LILSGSVMPARKHSQPEKKIFSLKPAPRLGQVSDEPSERLQDHENIALK
jgi:hypothetical protein